MRSGEQPSSFHPEGLCLLQAQVLLSRPWAKQGLPPGTRALESRCCPASAWSKSGTLNFMQEPAMPRGAGGLAGVLLWEGAPSGFLLDDNFIDRPW